MIAFFATFITIVFALLAPGVADRVAAPAFMATILILGLPHGTIDSVLLCSRKLSSRWLGISSRTLWVGAYLGVALGYGIFWRAAPVLGMLLFLLLTIIHWGTSEYSRKGRSDWRWYGLGLTRGSLVVIGVLALQPGGSESAIEMVTGDRVVLPVSALRGTLAAVVMAHLALLFAEDRDNRRRFLKRASDSLLIIVLLALTPALLGMAIYYAFFHAERYYRLFESDSRSLLGVTHVLCAVLVVGVGMVFANFDLLGSGALAIHFRYLAALTLPHTLLVWHLQRREMKSSVISTEFATV